MTWPVIWLAMRMPELTRTEYVSAVPGYHTLGTAFAATALVITSPATPGIHHHAHHIHHTSVHMTTDWENFCTWVITCAHSMPQQNANVLAGISLQNMDFKHIIWLHIIFHPRAQAHYRFDTEETAKTQHDPAIKQWLKSTESTARLPFIPPPFPSFPPLPPGRESRGVAKTTVTGVARFCGTLPWMLDVG